MHRLHFRPSAPRVTAAVFLAALLLAPLGDCPSLIARGADQGPAVSTIGTAEAQSRTRRARGKRATTRRVRATRAPAAPSFGWTSPRGSAELSNDFANMINNRVRSGKFGVMVVSLTRGDTLFAHGAGDMMQPASTMKLYSTAAALDRFGPEHVFSTDVLRDSASAPAGTVNGNIYLRGDGDPSMSSRFWKDPNYPMETLARAVAAA